VKRNRDESKIALGAARCEQAFFDMSWSNPMAFHASRLQHRFPYMNELKFSKFRCGIFESRVRRQIMFRRFLQEENGATAIEYGLIAAMFGVTMIAAFNTLQGEYISMFGTIETAVIGAGSP